MRGVREAGRQRTLEFALANGEPLGVSARLLEGVAAGVRLYLTESGPVAAGICSD